MPDAPEPSPANAAKNSLEADAQDLIAEARRPILIERHRQLIEEMESGLSDSFITGETDHPRLKAMLQELEAESEQQRIATTLAMLADDSHYANATLRAALVEHLCLMREHAKVEVAALQLHTIGVYREVRKRVGMHQGELPVVADLRDLPANVIPRLLNPGAAQFGSSALASALVYTPAFGERSLRAVRRLRRPEMADTQWEEAAGEPALSREQEEPLAALDDRERKLTRQLLIRDRIRSQFFRDVFLRFLHRDELDPTEVDVHATVLHWLQGIEATGHLYRFMQGQTAGQKAFRLAQLTQKIIQLHEMYARVAQAGEHPSYRTAFAGKRTKERLALLARDRYPLLALTPELSLSAMLCPFTVFVAWVQEQTGNQDFVLPPDPRR